MLAGTVEAAALDAGGLAGVLAGATAPPAVEPPGFDGVRTELTDAGGWAWAEIWAAIPAVVTLGLECDVTEAAAV